MPPPAPTLVPLRLLAFLLLAAAGCAMTDRPERRDPQTITILYPGGDERLFGPEWDDSPKFLMFQPLATYEGSSCGDPAPALAERWEPSADRRSWTVWLREGVRWHDGVPVTAEDIAFNLRLWRHPAVAWYGGGGVDSTEVLDPRTLRVLLREPGNWPLQGWDVFYPKHHLDSLPPGDFFNAGFWTRPVGNGPYRYVRHVPETMIELEANPDYFGGKPRIERVILQFKGVGAGSSLLELRTGKVDLIPGVPPLEAATLTEDPRFHVYYVLQGASSWLLWNHTDPRLSDARVRRAFAHAVDRRLLHRTLALPDELPLTDAAFVPCQATRGTLLPPWPHDAGEAARLLSEAGWHDADGDGLREWHGRSGPGLPRRGDPLRFTVTTAARFERSAVFVSDQLRRIGADLQVQLLDGSLVHQRFRDGRYEAILTESVRAERAYAKGGTALGAPDAELARLLVEADAEEDPELQVELYRELGERYRRIAPAMFLNMRVGTLVAHRRIQGIGEPGTVLPRMAWRWPFGGLEDLWLAPEEP